MIAVRLNNRGRQRGFIMMTVLMILVIFTGASIAAMYSVTASIKGTGFMRERMQRFYEADGGWQAVFSYMCDRGITTASTSFETEYNNNALLYNVGISDLRTVKRQVPGYSGDLLGRDILLSSTDTHSGKANTEALVFVGQAQISGGYGNE